MSVTDSVHIPFLENFVPQILRNIISMNVEHLYFLQDVNSINFHVYNDCIRISYDDFDFDVYQYRYYKVTISFNGTIHLEFFSPENDITIKIIDETYEVNSARIKSANNKPRMSPFAIDIQGQPKNDIKVVFDLNEMNKKYLFDGPIAVNTPQGTDIKTGYITTLEGGSIEDEPLDYFKGGEEPDDDENQGGETQAPKKFPVGGIIGIVVGCIVVIAIVVVVVIVVLKKKKADKSNDEQSELEDAHNI